MPNAPRARRKALLLGVATASATALVASMLGTPAQATTPPAARHAAAGKQAHHKLGAKVSLTTQSDRSTRAKLALTRAQRALSSSTPASKRPDATLALRNLWLLKDSLSPADRAAAEKLSARPKKPAEVGDANILVHYDPAELTTYSITDALTSLQYVADSYANSGYRRPLSDGKIGGDGRIDIYLAQLDPGLYGYCTTDQKRYKGKGHDVWAFCVLDADYVGFPAHTPLQNLQVTAAHEYYHATQFAYDFNEDPWLLESTAAWAEDELYSDVNDNVQYLADSPITKPTKSIDKFGGVFHYGVWNFFRYLTEKYPADTGLLPTLLLKVWQDADSTKGPRKDLYSTQAVNKALKKEGHSSLAKEFGLYSAATRYTHTSFSEGAAQNYPVKPLAGGASLGPAKKKSFKTALDHLTSQTYQFVPSGTSATSTLKVQLRMGAKQTGSSAVVTVFGPSGVLQTKTVKVNRRGVAKKKFAFGGGVVSSVEVTLVNASTRYRNCDPVTKPSPYACGGGDPVDQHVRAILKAKASA